MKYRAGHIQRLRREASNRFEMLMRTLGPSDSFFNSVAATEINISGIDVRLAVQDLRVILSEIYKLK